VGAPTSYGHANSEQLQKTPAHPPPGAKFGTREPFSSLRAPILTPPQGKFKHEMNNLKRILKKIEEKY
jgi:hypothetical protein